MGTVLWAQTLCLIDSMVLLPDIFGAHFARVTGYHHTEYFLNYVVHARWCPSSFQLCHLKLPWDCLHLVVDRMARASILAKLFITPESPNSFPLGTIKITGICFGGGYCRWTAALCSNDCVFYCWMEKVVLIGDKQSSILSILNFSFLQTFSYHILNGSSSLSNNFQINVYIYYFHNFGPLYSPCNFLHSFLGYLRYSKTALSHGSLAWVGLRLV
jgi:hypothetical protein